MEDKSINSPEKAFSTEQQARINAALDYATAEIQSFFAGTTFGGELVGTVCVKSLASTIAASWLSKSTSKPITPLDSRIDDEVKQAYVELAKIKSRVWKIPDPNRDALELPKTNQRTWNDPTLAPSDRWKSVSYAESTIFRNRLDTLVECLRSLKLEHDPSDEWNDYREGSAIFVREVQSTIKKYFPEVVEQDVFSLSVPLRLRDQIADLRNRTFVRLLGSRTASDLENLTTESYLLFDRAMKYRSFSIPRIPAFPISLQRLYEYLCDLQRWCECGGLVSGTDQQIIFKPRSEIMVDHDVKGKGGENVGSTKSDSATKVGRTAGGGVHGQAGVPESGSKAGPEPAGQNELLANAGGMLSSALKRLPALWFAVGIGGIAFVVSAIVKLNLPPLASVLGIVGVFIGMFALVLFAGLVQPHAADAVKPPVSSKIALWYFMVIVFLIATLTVSSVFFNTPIPARDLLIGKKVVSESPETMIENSSTSAFTRPTSRADDALNAMKETLLKLTVARDEYNAQLEKLQDELRHLTEKGNKLSSQVNDAPAKVHALDHQINDLEIAEKRARENRGGLTQAVADANYRAWEATRNSLDRATSDRNNYLAAIEVNAHERLALTEQIDANLESQKLLRSKVVDLDVQIREMGHYK